MDERKLRSVIVRILKENEGDAGFSYDPYEYSGYGGGGGGGGDSSSGPLAKAFLDPFKDLGKAFGAAGKDIINSTKLIVKSLYTFSPEKLNKARGEYNQRKKAIEQEWGPILKKTAGAIEGSDLGLITFALAPNIFFAIQMAKFAKGAPMAVGDYLDKAGLIPSLPDSWKQKIDRSAFSSDRAWEKFRSKNTRSGKSDSGGSGSKSVSDRLKIFFFGQTIESLSHSADDLILEDDNKQASSSEEDYKKQFDALFGDQGEKLRDQIVDLKKGIAVAAVTDAKTQIDNIKNATDENIRKEITQGQKNKEVGEQSKDQEKAIEDFVKTMMSQRDSAIQNVIDSAKKVTLAALADDTKGVPESIRTSPGGEAFRNKMQEIASDVVKELDSLSKASSGSPTPKK
jgi:inosine/xanthosine triphosphate pyrophosphatase family protein